MIATLYSNAGEMLDDGVVHIWQFACSQAIGEHAYVLSEAERATAARFVAVAHREAYAVQHAIVRLVLARYVDRAPEHLEFASGPRGKPMLVDAGGIELNLSHASDVGLLAVARVAVGVDIERLDANIDPRQLGRMVLARDEHAPDRAAFLRIWCRKEAALKATGLGLIDDLRAISVARDRVDVLGTTVYLRDLAFGADHAAAVATAVDIPPIAARPIATLVR